MNPAAISVIGVIGAAVLGAVINQWWMGHNEERKARRDYEYEAKKKLLTEVQPILFELSERCDDAFWRIYHIAESETRNRLEAASPKPRFRAESGYFLPSTIYRLVSPLVLIRMLETELGRFDLSLVPEATAKYRLAKKLYRTWNSGEVLADCGTASIRYNPEGEPVESADYDASVHALQHVRLGAIDNLVDLLTVPDGDDTTRCMRYGEFQAKYDAMKKEKAERKAKGIPWSSHHFAALNRTANVFTNFSPTVKPVLWRILMTQAVLLHSITLDFDPKKDLDYDEVIETVRAKFSPIAADKSLDVGLDAARSYLSSHAN